MGAGKPAPTLYSFAPLTHIIFRSQSSLQMLRSLRSLRGMGRSPIPKRERSDRINWWCAPHTNHQLISVNVGLTAHYTGSANASHRSLRSLYTYVRIFLPTSPQGEGGKY